MISTQARADHKSTAFRFRSRDSKRAAATWEAIDDSEVQREMFRKPRDALLALAATFLELTTSRLKEIGKLTGDNNKMPDVMDHKSHVVIMLR